MVDGICPVVMARGADVSRYLFIALSLHGVSGCSSKLDIVFVIDSSGSIRSERFPKVLNFVNSIVDQYEVSSDATRIGAVVFSDSASVQFQLNAFKSKQDVMSAVSQIKFIGGRTNTAGGLQLMVGVASFRIYQWFPQVLRESQLTY